MGVTSIKVPLYKILVISSKFGPLFIKSIFPSDFLICCGKLLSAYCVKLSLSEMVVENDLAHFLSIFNDAIYRRIALSGLGDPI